MDEQIELPKVWGLSGPQDVVIGGLLDYAGQYVAPADFCDWIYGEACDGPAPAKLRVLVQRCRALIEQFSDGRVEVQIKRNSGWKITKDHAIIMKNIIAEYE